MRKPPKPVARQVSDVCRGCIEVHEISIALEHRLYKAVIDRFLLALTNPSHATSSVAAVGSVTKRRHVQVSRVTFLYALNVFHEAARQPLETIVEPYG